MKIGIEVNGVLYQGFDAVKTFRSVETVSGNFGFQTSAKLEDTFPIRSGQACVIKVDKIPVITGFVENVSVTYDSGSHNIQIEGRDRTCDLIDSAIGPGSEFSGPITFEELCKLTLSRMGLTNIKVINNVDDLDPFSGSELVSAEVDKKGFEFLESYARQRQVFLTTDGLGNLVITRGSDIIALTSIQNIIGSNNNNILSGSYSDNRSERYNRYEILSQKSPASISFGDDFDSGSEQNNETISNQSGSSIDDEIRATRNLYMKLEEAGDSKTGIDRADWESTSRRVKGKKYSVTVQGFYQDLKQTKLWVPNELVNVSDDFADIRSQMLIWSVEYNYSVSEGSTTTLELSPPDALQLLSLDPKKRKKHKKLAPVGIKWGEDFNAGS